ncbi:MAG: DNA-directed RNA polymerase subunit beta, partial [Planctomycetes bacterium]|nr:DNA-directed RNA polymerase subunit beta [Planctomycetota bacterium]
MEVRNYGKVQDAIEVPDLTAIQTKSFSDFLQADVPPAQRRNQGLEALMREIFPIKSFDGSLSLEYLRYELGRPRYTEEECRKLKLTYARPWRVWLRLNKAQPVEEDVFLGEMPIMVGGGEFIVNGTERVIVTQLHRSPGVDFLEESRGPEKKLHSCRIIPERGSWIEMTIGRKDTVTVRIDQTGQIPITCLLRAISPDYSTDGDIIRLFYETEKISLKGQRLASKLVGRHVVGEVVDKKTGEVVLEAGQAVNESVATVIIESELEEVEVIKAVDDPLILNCLADDTTAAHEEALMRIYQRLRPGNPPHLEKAKQMVYERFFDPSRYRLGRVGRFRLNRKFGQDVPETEMTLMKEDIINAIRYLLKLRRGQGQVDDIDHLGNRRLRTIDELAGDEIRKGLLRLKRTVQDRMGLKAPEEQTPRMLVNSKTVSSAVEYFFGRSELSQVVEQTNPLDQITHERKLSALGPGGLNRKRAGFEVRDVHISHYGRICPIETPEGTNIGLITSLSLYATVDKYGFLTTPYRRVGKGRKEGDIAYLRADEEEGQWIAPADIGFSKTGKIATDTVLARHSGDFQRIDPKRLSYMDVSPRQLVGVSGSLIPFLEHNDANRALMGSNMQRQAVPLLRTEPPLVATGMEKSVAENSGMVVVAQKAGAVTRVSATEITIDDTTYKLRKFDKLNERTCLNQKPIVSVG